MLNVVSVIGLGYIGLPTAALLARNGMDVIGVDTNPSVVETINRGGIHIVEPGLSHVIADVVAAGRLRAVVAPEPADAFILAVPTPVDHATREPDLEYVEEAFRSVASVLKGGDTIILESTSPVGTTDRMAELLAGLRPDLRVGGRGVGGCDVHLAFCPERVLPGRVLEELVANARVIGGMDAASSARAAEVYRIFVRGELQTTDARTAEMVKLTENAFRDANIAFANELSLVCDDLGINVWELIGLANRHPRVNILRPGPGVGGHCIAVDPWFIIAQFPRLAKLMRTAREVNDAKPEWVLRKVLAARDARLAGAAATVRVAVLGLAFKPNVDDLRESPACRIAAVLAGEDSLALRLVEPHIDTPPAALAGLKLFSLDDALRDADIVLILVAHDQFKGLRGKVRKEQKVIDCVGLLE